jgi:hypothetical protein
MDRGVLRELRADVRRHCRRIGVHLSEDFGDDARLLLDEGQQEMFGGDFGVPVAVGQRLGAGDCFLGFLGIFLDVHNL